MALQSAEYATGSLLLNFALQGSSCRLQKQSRIRD